MEDSDGEEEPAPVIKEESVRDTTGDIVNDDDLAAVPKLESQEELRLRQQVEQELKRRAADMDMVESPFTGDMIPLAEISAYSNHAFKSKVEGAERNFNGQNAIDFTC